MQGKYFKLGDFRKVFTKLSIGSKCMCREQLSTCLFLQIPAKDYRLTNAINCIDWQSSNAA